MFTKGTVYKGVARHREAKRFASVSMLTTEEH